MDRIDLKRDIYYTKKYANTYLEKNGKVIEFEYNKQDKYFKNISIKTAITKIADVKINDGYFDSQTPYGYGGYLTNSDDPVFIKTALKKYREFCIKNKIIAEFLRFHPFNGFPSRFGRYLDFCADDRKVVYVDIEKSYEEIWNAYLPSLKRNIKKANKTELKLVRLHTINWDEFLKSYYKTMLRHNAQRFYFFKKNYFKKLEKLKGFNLYCSQYKNKHLNFIAVLESYPFVYYHLGATNPAYYHLNPNPFAFDELIKLYQRKGFQVFYLGGGTSRNENDSLYKFKNKFSPLNKSFYIGGNIFLPEFYEKYLELWSAKNKNDNVPAYFLKYRL
jgi:hypothetical protein